MPILRNTNSVLSPRINRPNSQRFLAADRSISQPLEKLMDGRRLYQSEGIAEKCILPCEGSPRVVLCAAPIIAAGDVTGVVALLTEDRTATPDAAQLKAVNVAAAFLARQMEE